MRGSFLVAALALCAGCGAPDPTHSDDEDDEALGAEYTERVEFNRHHVLDDLELTDWDAMSAAEVQAFLENNPYGWRSVLADHWSNGQSAAQAMVAAAQTHEINPLVILTRVQLEQSLIGKKTATQSALDWAMGCGCPDNQACNPQYKGFDKQIDCMASRFRSYLDDLASVGTTVAGWGVGSAKTTLDGFSVTPENAATASVYTYTPWVASAKNHVLIWAKYVGHVGYVPSSDPPAPDPEDPPAGDPSDPLAIVVDSDDSQNGSDAAFTASSAWTASSSTQGYYGSDYRYRSTGTGSDLALFEIYLPEAQTVVVEAWWTPGGNRSSAAPFLVYDADGVHLGTFYADQKQGGGAWMPLGTYALTAGWNTVALSRWAAAGEVVIADAVRVRTP